MISHNNFKILSGIIVIIYGFFIISGESAPQPHPYDGNPPAWNFLLRKPEPVKIIPKRKQVEGM